MPRARALPRRILSCVAAVLVASLLHGCVALTLEPLLGDADVIREPLLSGTWVQDHDGTRIVVAEDDASGYRVQFLSGEDSIWLGGRLGRLAGRLVMELTPAPPDHEVRELYRSLLVPGYLIMAVEPRGDSLFTAQLELDSIGAALSDGRLDLEASLEDQRAVLHGTAARLRAALEPYMLRPEVWSEPTGWRRLPQQAVVPERVPVPCTEAAAWREADRLFRQDPRWLGGDVASSVDLGGDRTLWLFGDSWVATAAGSTRATGAHMVTNTLAVQTGRDPSSARMTFHWRTSGDGTPEAMFPPRGGEWLWFGSGARVQDRLLLFMARTVRRAPGSFGFDFTGWTAFLVENPDAEPPAWRVRELETPTNPLGVLVGFAATYIWEGHLYALGSQNPVKSHPVFAVRWPLEAARLGHLMQPEWWAGSWDGWVADSTHTQRRPLFENGHTELTVHYDGVSRAFVATHTTGFGSADVVLRAAPRLEGPWSAPRAVYRPPEHGRHGISIYAGKAHPQLSGADLVLTYVTNSFMPESLLTDDGIYYPRFIRLTRCPF
jgi:hypothetical protein